jgi:TonB family protein
VTRHDLRTQYRFALAIGLLASICVHVLVLQFAPGIHVGGAGGGSGVLQVVHIPPVPTVAAPPETRVPEEPAPIPAPAMPVAGDLSAPPEAPRMIPYEIAPKLENPVEVQRILQELYPAEYREQRVGGVVVLWLFIDTEGNVAKVLVRVPSGHDQFDQAAQEVAHRMAFRPAYIRGHPVGVWVSQGIRFQVQEPADSNALRPGSPDSAASSGPSGLIPD